MKHDFLSYEEFKVIIPFKSAKSLEEIEELEKNVCILDPSWNTTLLEEEFDVIPHHLHKYCIVKSKKDDTRIRHFAGGQMWRIP